VSLQKKKAVVHTQQWSTEFMKTDGINTDALLNNAANTTVWHTIRMTTLSVHYKEAD